MINDLSKQSTDHMQESEKLNIKVQYMFSLKLNFMVQNTPSCFSRAIFNKVTKVIQDCTLYFDWSRKLVLTS